MLKFKSQSLIEYLVIGGLVAMAALPLITPYSKSVSQKIIDAAPAKNPGIDTTTENPNLKEVTKGTPKEITPLNPIKVVERPPDDIKEPPHPPDPPKPPDIKKFPPINGCNACQNVGYFSNLNEYGMTQIDHDLRVSPDALLCSLFWYFPEYQGKYGLGDNVKMSAGDEIHRRYFEEGKLMCDPYEVNIGGSNYVFVRDLNKDGIFNGVEEILGFSDNESNLFKELKSLDANGDGYVSAEELDDAGVALLKDDNGKLTNEEYPIDNVNGVKLTSLSATDAKAQSAGIYGTFTLDLKNDETVQGKETFKFIAALSVLTAGIAGAYVFSRHRNRNNSNV